jgi:hypothetical protein
MINFIFTNGILIYNEQELECSDFLIDGDFVTINLINEQNDIWVLFQANEISINGVIQTSAQMIIDTLTNA